MIADQPVGERDQVGGRHLGHAAVGPAVGRAEAARHHTNFSRYLIHSLDEKFLASIDADRQHRRGVVARDGDQPLEQFVDADLFARAQEHGRAAAAAVPFLPRRLVDREDGVARQFAVLDQVEHDIGGHHLRHRGGRKMFVGAARKEDRARIHVLEHHDRRLRRVERAADRGGSLFRRIGHAAPSRGRAAARAPQPRRPLPWHAWKCAPSWAVSGCAGPARRGSPWPWPWPPHSAHRPRWRRAPSARATGCPPLRRCRRPIWPRHWRAPRC